MKEHVSNPSMFCMCGHHEALKNPISDFSCFSPHTANDIYFTLQTIKLICAILFYVLDCLQETLGLHGNENDYQCVRYTNVVFAYNI